MAIFMVVPTGNEVEALTSAIHSQQAAETIKYLELPRGEFFISFKGTCQELSDLLKITDGTSGSAVIVLATAYYGRAGANIWEWVNAHWEG